MYVYHNDGRIIGVSSTALTLDAEELQVQSLPVNTERLVRDFKVEHGTIVRKFRKVDPEHARIAFVSVWGIECGISTYSEFLVTAMRKLGVEVVVFAETYEGAVDDENTVYCWNRGHDLSRLQAALKEYDPDFIFVQHEYGIFPDARHWTKFVSFLDHYNYVVALHSVYWHKDKTVCEAVCRRIIVHSEIGKEVLRAKGIAAPIKVIPHGCIEGKDLTRLWNIYRSRHTMMQFGFGFEYKGWTTALEAVRLLKDRYPDIFYLILFSESKFSVDYHNSQFAKLERLIEEQGLSEFVAVIRGYQPEPVIDIFLRTVRVAVFPYTSHPDHVVYGSTGAARIAMANGTPTVTSTLPIFDDLKGIVPQVEDAEQLAAVIDKIFSDPAYYESLRTKALEYVAATSWEQSAKQYLEVLSSE